MRDDLFCYDPNHKNPILRQINSMIWIFILDLINLLIFSQQLTKQLINNNKKSIHQNENFQIKSNVFLWKWNLKHHFLFSSKLSFSKHVFNLRKGIKCSLRRSCLLDLFMLVFVVTNLYREKCKCSRPECKMYFKRLTL